MKDDFGIPNCIVNPEDFDMNMEEVNLQEFEDVLAQSVANL